MFWKIWFWKNNLLVNLGGAGAGAWGAGAGAGAGAAAFAGGAAAAFLGAITQRMANALKPLLHKA